MNANINADEYGDEKRVPKIVRSIGEIRGLLDDITSDMMGAGLDEDDKIAFCTGVEMMYKWLVGKTDDIPRW